MTTTATSQSTTPASKANISFGPEWKEQGKLPTGTPYLKNLRRGVQTENGKPVMDFYGNRYELEAVKGQPDHFTVKALIGTAVRAPRGGRTTSAVQAPDKPKPGKGTGKAGKGQDSQGKGPRQGKANKGGQPKTRATGGKAKASGSTSAAKTPVSPN